jgi:hypothetical protein
MKIIKETALTLIKETALTLITQMKIIKESSYANHTDENNQRKLLR